MNITRPDLAFACSQWRKFVQYPGVYICKLLSECYNVCVVLMIKELLIELLIVTLELKSRTNSTNRDRSRHVDVKVHYLRDQVRDGLVKCAGTQNFF